MSEYSEALLCPYCEQPIELPATDQPLRQPCPACARMVDLEAQLTFHFGYDVFSDAQDIYLNVSPKKRTRERYEAAMEEATRLFIGAYTNIQQAFRADLPEDIRERGIEVMASMVQFFLPRNMISPLEASYWTMLMVELTAQLEYLDLKAKLDNPKRGLLVRLKRIRWSIRHRQLAKSLVYLDQKIRNIEFNIEFVERPRARRVLRSV